MMAGEPVRAAEGKDRPLPQAEGDEGVRTAAGISVKPLYTSADPSGAGLERNLGVPGQPPYTRGIYPTMYRGRPWTIRQLAGFGTPEDTNARLRFLLEQGATGVNTVFDYVTNRGYDSDHPFAEGDVGQGGVAVDSLNDMLALYDGIPLDRASVSIVLSHPVAAGAIFAMYLAAVEKRGYRRDHLAGTLQNDFMMETVVLTAPNILQPRFSFKLSMDVVEFCARHVPRWNPISFTGYNYREAGANAAQEVALVVSNAVATIEEMGRRGLSVDSVAPRLSSFFSADNDFFEEIAKYRAARRVYYRIITERFRPANPRSAMLRFHVQTAGSALTAQQPMNNIVRATCHALAAVLGGTQSLHVSAYDEALCVPSEQSALLALRTQHILLEEAGISRTVDPLAGSYYVEHLTDVLEERITDYVRQIDELGGLVQAVERGWVHRECLRTAYERERAIATGAIKVVGVNCHTDDLPVRAEVFRVPDALSRQREKLGRLRASRESDRVQAARGGLQRAVEENENTMPFLIDAVKAGATLGECCEIFRSTHGGWVQPLL